MQVNGSITITRDTTVGDLLRQLAEDNIPATATIGLYVAPSDRQPGDGIRQIKLSWDTKDVVKKGDQH